MDLARLILEYIETLIWPALVLVILWRYRTVLDKVVARLKEADEVSILGVGWKLRRELVEFSDSPSLPPAARDELKQKVAESAVDELRLRARDFELGMLPERRRVAAEVEQLALQVPLSEAVRLTQSVLAGERVAAGIVISAHLRTEAVAGDRPEVLDAVARGLEDPSSFVRYRFARIAQSQPPMAKRLKVILERIVKTEKNRAVLSAARKALKHAAS